MKKFLYIRSLCFTVVSLVFSLHAYDQIGIKEGKPFPFPIKAKAYHPLRGLLFVGAHQVPTDADKGFSIALAEGDSKTFTAYAAAEESVINGTEKQKNPLRGTTIAQMGLLTTHPIVVTDQEPAILQLIESANSKTVHLVRSSPLIDWQGHPSAGILAVAGLSGVKDEEEAIAPLAGGMSLFAVVKPQSGVFGNVGSGIAIVLTEKKTEKIPTDATGKKERSFLTLSQPATKQLDTSSAVLKIAAGSNLVSLASPILVADPVRDNVYIGLQGVGGAAGGLHGAIGIDALGNFSFFKLVPDVALSVDGDYIIAGAGASKTVSIFQLAPMQTTTKLPYLVVVGGSGVPADMQKMVYALPLVSKTGRLASKTAVPVEQFSPIYPFSLMSRTFTTPVTTNADLYLQSDYRVMVGGGAAPGPITDMVVSGDAVFVAVAASDANTYQPGIFYSQPLFDEVGRIKWWTNWQRCSGLAEPVFGLALDEYAGNFWALTGATAETITSVKRTKWSQETTGLGALYDRFFPKDKGGAQGLFDFSPTTPGFSIDPATRLAVTILTGYQQVVLAQTGIVTAGLFGPNQGLGQSLVSTDGTLTGFVPGTTAVACSGGVLASLGAITSAAVLVGSGSSWIVVGGSGGIAVLAHADGTGIAGELQSGFVGLDASMRWIKLGTTAQVRKLMVRHDSVVGGAKLFVLTNTTLERFDMTPVVVQSGNSAVSTVLARAGIFAGLQNIFFSDALISAPFGLLATSGGLVRVGNGVDIATAVDQQSVGWTVVPFNESVGPVSRLYGISITGREEDLMNVYAGNVYFLNAFVGYHQTRLYRFTLDYGLSHVTDTTLQKFPDCFVKDTPTFYLNIGDYRNYLATDGAMMALSQSRYIEQPPYVSLLAPGWQANRSRQAVERALKVVQPLTGKSMSRMLRQFASGAWFVGTDVGLFVNE